MDIKLTNVISDILGKSGQAIISSIIAGERDACQLASLADPRCKSSRENLWKPTGMRISCSCSSKVSIFIITKRKNPVGLILRSSANSLKASKTPLGSYFRKIQAKSGYIPPIIATANKLGRIIYTMVKNQTEFDESFIGINEEERLRRKLIRMQIELEKIQNQIKKHAS